MTYTASDYLANGELKPEFSRRNELEAGKNRRGNPLYLLHRTAGFELAGSGTRQVGEAYGVIFVEPSGVTGGQWFKTETEARERFNLWNVKG